jgi:hypothetical protein
MRAIIAASLGLVVGALVGFGLATCWLVNEYQSLRYMLEDVHLTVPINIRDRPLKDVAKALAEEVKHQKSAQIQFVFSPATLANEMSITFTELQGHGYFAVLALGKAYQCQVELVGDRVILFMRSDKSTSASVE